MNARKVSYKKFVPQFLKHKNDDTGRLIKKRRESIHINRIRNKKGNH